uniref:Uncharacterized protein n=1 Tax=Arundo donax TaxID=35708 RepID=A0A0A9B8W5_ARUDO
MQETTVHKKTNYISVHTSLAKSTKKEENTSFSHQ